MGTLREECIFEADDGASRIQKMTTPQMESQNGSEPVAVAELRQGLRVGH